MNAKDMQQKISEIEEQFFAGCDSVSIEQGMESIPVVAANLSKSTNSFTQGQSVYVFDGYWGMAERVKVVGRYRRKNRFVKGVCQRANLENHRPKIIYEPAVIRKLIGETIRLSTIVGCSSDGL